MTAKTGKAAEFQRNMRRRLYSLCSGRHFFLHDDVDDKHWMRRKVDATVARIQKAIANAESTIIMVLGRPGSGKTFLVRSALARIRELATADAQQQGRIELISLEAYNHKDETRCMKYLLQILEKLSRANAVRGTNVTVNELQERMMHSLKLLKRSHVYVVFVLEGIDVLTKGSNDCSVSAGSCTKRQGLLYFMGNILTQPEYAFALICVTADIRTTERLEKRVRSRFMHETVYCEDASDMDAVFGPEGLTTLGPKCEVSLDADAKALLAKDVVCGADVKTAVASACVLLPEDAFEELEDDRLRISCDAMSDAVRQVKGREYLVEVFRQISLPEHYILVALTRLHCRKLTPVTLIDVERDLADMVNFFPREKHAVPHFQGLLRIFRRLVHLGLVEWVNFEHNKVAPMTFKTHGNDLQGTNAPCRFAEYKMYLAMPKDKLIPTYLATWLEMATRTLQ